MNNIMKRKKEVDLCLFASSRGQSLCFFLGFNNSANIAKTKSFQIYE